MQRRLFLIAFVLAVVTAGGCTRSPTSSAPATGQRALLGTIPVTPLQSHWPLMVVTKNASCGCCGAWVERMRAAGFQVEVHDVDNLDPIKTRLGIPAGKGSCHTAEIGGYFVEGHVPADDIKRLLAQRPAAKGLVLPGMPVGSPGMEVPGGAVQSYTVELIDQQGGPPRLHAIERSAASEAVNPAPLGLDSRPWSRLQTGAISTVRGPK